MQFEVLGPLTMIHRRANVAPTAPKQRQMLGLLLCNANRVVTVTQLVDELWGYSPPSSAIAAVHTYVAQLRRQVHGSQAALLTPAERLITRDQGYLIRVRDGELDLELFTRILGRARRTLELGLYELAASQFRAALDLWDGRNALVDVEAGPILGAAADAIERDRLEAIVGRVRSELALGRHHELLGELSGLVHRHPTHERISEMLMLALYRSGRQADALAAYYALHRRLHREHSTTPDPRIRQLHLDIVSARRELDVYPGARTRLSLDFATSFG